jgi:hypothetical protein
VKRITTVTAADQEPLAAEAQAARERARRWLDRLLSRSERAGGPARHRRRSGSNLSPPSKARARKAHSMLDELSSRVKVSSTTVHETGGISTAWAVERLVNRTAAKGGGG